jgi:hypothetical protein
VSALKQRSDENGWDPDLQAFTSHRQQAERLSEQKDLSGAFAEFCRAMLPLSKALSKHRRKEEVFQPVWDKTPRQRNFSPPAPPTSPLRPDQPGQPNKI